MTETLRHICDGSCGDRIDTQAETIRAKNEEIAMLKANLAEECAARQSTEKRMETLEVMYDQQREKVHILHRHKDYARPDRNWDGGRRE